ncbi:HSP20 family protein [Atopostipes suicloacalis DSM 15692]|uniref:HSP20 family protein n=1 Tax=Atopostipes suicloacalis DSM 15692 TaxID=1121025 RepID=A0A1M4XSW2_9LACT|nr:Hsp20/alpha crystallin family protein [Atopostipes suicloacalis]SHE96561.1 HSP20 family protein [Atopostipes suicloacalis DSM 15692]
MNNLFPTRRDFMDMNRHFMGDSFDRFFADTGNFNVDIKENEDAYTVEADLPGLAKEDIELDYKNDVLSIRAQQETSTEEKDDESNYIRRERSSRSYNRQFLIKDVDEDNITAEFDNGVLKVQLPKTETDGQNTKKIDIQ